MIALAGTKCKVLDFQYFNDISNLYHTIFSKQALDFTCLQYKSFENNVGKQEIACNEQSLLFPQCF